jgi:hypothetical protein
MWPGYFLVEDEMGKIDYSKIDFGKLELRWGFLNPEAGIGRSDRELRITVKGRGTLCARKECEPWRNYTTNGETFEELEQLKAICNKVDAFIESELARIKLEEEYPMSAEQAHEFLKANPGEHLFSERTPGGYSDDDIWYRCEKGVIQWHSEGDPWKIAEAFDDYRYRLIASRPAKRVVKMTCLELCRRMVAEPRREFTIKSPSGDSVHRFDPVFCVFQWHNGKGQWFLLSDGGLHSKLIDVELSESETVKVEKPETVELGDISVDNCGWWSYGNLKKLEQGKWRITATRVTG